MQTVISLNDRRRQRKVKLAISGLHLTIYPHVDGLKFAKLSIAELVPALVEADLRLDGIPITHIQICSWSAGTLWRIAREADAVVIG